MASHMCHDLIVVNEQTDVTLLVIFDSGRQRDAVVLVSQAGVFAPSWHCFNVTLCAYPNKLNTAAFNRGRIEASLNFVTARQSYCDV